MVLNSNDFTNPKWLLLNQIYLNFNELKPNLIKNTTTITNTYIVQYNRHESVD